MAALDACPLCRSALAPAVQACPSCGADLAPYLLFAGHAEHYLNLALELVARGEAASARSIAERLEQLAPLEPQRKAELAARLALADGELDAAADYARACAPEQQAQLMAQLESARLAQQRGLELYNHALAAARSGALALAALHLEQAVAQLPHVTELWQLKLKVDLKRQCFTSCYRDLQALDRLHARPPELSGLERLLPPVATG